MSGFFDWSPEQWERVKVSLDEGADRLERPRMPRCRDYDADCEEIPDKTHCWLHDPARGFCPYLGRTDD